MESLPADIQRKIALDLNPAELFRLCSDDTYKQTICESREFWLLKLERDYPDMLNYYNRHGMKLQNPKNTYIKKFTKYSESVERFVNNWYLPEERKEKYDILYNLYREWLALPVSYSGRSPILKYPFLLKSPKLDNIGMEGEVYKLLEPFVKEDLKYKY